VFAVGDLILHYDGNPAETWTEMTFPPAHPLGVWGSSSSDVYAVGEPAITFPTSGLVLHWDGTSWSQLTIPDVPTLRAVWGSGPRDVFAVGGGGTVLHYDGSTWKIMAAPKTQSLNGVWGTGPGDVFAVGTGAIMHYDGISWTPMRSDVAATLSGVWGQGPSVFAVGAAGAITRLSRHCDLAETRCSDGRDDDCDGLYDCGDPDCASDATCAAGGLCAGATPIRCGDTVTGMTTSSGPRNLTRYACDDWLEDGSETYYRLDATTSGTVMVSLSGMAVDLDLIVLAQGAGGGCEPRNPGCIGASSTNGPETVTFPATAGNSYYVVVDGFAANAGSFTLGVTCP
jgi:hypothetical protein